MIKEIPKKYLYLHLAEIRRSKNTNEVEIVCQSSNRFYTFLIQDWQLGYDFYNWLDDYYSNEYDEEDYNGITNEELLLNTYIHLAEKIEKWKELKVKGQNGIRLTPSTLCNICKHRTSYTTCEAFPSGIPKELHNKLHTEKLPTQKNDIVFEMGEEGSKNAGIKPMDHCDARICSMAPAGWDEWAKLKQGLIEEKYTEVAREKVLS